MNAVTEMPAPLVFTDSAANKVKQLIEEEGNPELKLRVFVTGGGCSGFQYGFTFDEVAERGRHGDGEERRHAADRPDELPVPRRRRDRLPGRPGRRAIRDQESERADHLRLRVVVLRLDNRLPGKGAVGPFSFYSQQREVAVRQKLEASDERRGVAWKAASSAAGTGDAAGMAIDIGLRDCPAIRNS